MNASINIKIDYTINTIYNKKVFEKESLRKEVSLFLSKDFETKSTNRSAAGKYLFTVKKISGLPHPPAADSQ